MSQGIEAHRFRRLCAIFFLFNFAVILFGAVVRITGSGAGCGQHWPSCHGEILHLPASVETLIELSHRATSGLDLLLCLAVLVISLRSFEKGHLARCGAALALLFMVIEALVGARLVLSELVGMNDSLPRAVVMMIHLVNTSLLTSAILITYYAARKTSPRLIHWNRHQKASCAAMFVVLLLISATGAVTALGDTVYPAAQSSLNIGERFAADHGAQAHFLQRLRWIHPLVAVGGSAFMLMLCGGLLDRQRPGHLANPFVRWTLILVLVQVALGVVNILLSAPGWMQVLHLATATALWSTLTLASLHLAGDPPPPNASQATP